MTAEVGAAVLTARRAAQHIRLFESNDAYECLCILTVLPEPSPISALCWQIHRRLAVLMPLLRVWVHCPRASNGLLPRRSNLVGYAQWDARFDRFLLCQTIMSSSFSGRSQPGFSRHILRIGSRTSLEMSGRPGWPRLTFDVQATAGANDLLTSISGAFARTAAAHLFGGAKPGSQVRGQRATGRQNARWRGASREESALGGKNYRTSISSIRSDISRFSRGTRPAWLRNYQTMDAGLTRSRLLHLLRGH
jgi:hypothetical protein